MYELKSHEYARKQFDIEIIPVSAIMENYKLAYKVSRGLTMKCETISCEQLKENDVLINGEQRYKVLEIVRNLSISKHDENAVEIRLLNLATKKEYTRYCRGDKYPLVRESRKK